MKLILSTCILIICTVQSVLCEEDIIVQVEQGQLRGEQLETITGKLYYSFKGIPYAKPPVGSLRFKKPVKPEPWDGVRNATAHGSVCPQVNMISNKYIPGSEDCLFLNVYSPNVTTDCQLPVLFFIHGGHYKFGSGDVDMYGPDNILSEDVVLVTINYRLDSLGFINLGIADAPGNAGLKDQVLALKWVQTNIHKFGGSANNVTIYGESAGAASVGYHLVSNMSSALFQRAILSSGTPFNDFSTNYQSVARAFKLGKTLGIETKNATELLLFLQNVTYDKLINGTCAVLASEEIINMVFKRNAFQPEIEGDYGQERFLTEDPLKSLDDGNVNIADVMFGYNNQESVLLIPFFVNWTFIGRYNSYPELFVPSKMLTRFTPDVNLYLAGKIMDHYFGNDTIDVSHIREFIKYSTIASIVYDIHRYIRRWPQVGTVYLYKFSCYSSRNYYGQQGAAYNISGASHMDELFYSFEPKSLDLPLVKDSQEYNMVQLFTRVITNFAKYGNPSPASASLGITWPQFKNTSQAYVDIAENVTVGYAPDEEDIQFWESIFTEVGMTF